MQTRVDVFTGINDAYWSYNTFLWNLENVYPGGTPGSRQGSVLSKRGPSPANSFGRLFLSQDQSFRGTPLQDVPVGQENGKIGDPKNGKKRARLLLDARTELTDDELKVS